MKKLSGGAHDRAVGYLDLHGRELEKALYRWHFEDDSQSSVLEELARFQNEDGGFGHALEPDIHTPASSVIATTHAFALLRELDAGANEPAVVKGVKYLIRQYNADLDRWPIIPPETDLAPHAWWWEYAESEKNFGGFVYNPRLAVLGHLQHYAERVPSEWLSLVRRRAMADLRASALEAGMFDFHAGLELLGARGLPEADRAEVRVWLEKWLEALLVRDPSRWDEYHLKPVDVAPAPGSDLADQVPPELVSDHLDYLLDTQLDDGSWPLGWSWKERDPLAWEKSERAWKGHEIVRYLKIFQAYDRLESVAG